MRKRFLPLILSLTLLAALFAGLSLSAGAAAGDFTKAQVGDIFWTQGVSDSTDAYTSASGVSYKIYQAAVNGDVVQYAVALKDGGANLFNSQYVCVVDEVSAEGIATAITIHQKGDTFTLNGKEYITARDVSGIYLDETTSTIAISWYDKTQGVPFAEDAYNTGANDFVKYAYDENTVVFRSGVCEQFVTPFDTTGKAIYKDTDFVTHFKAIGRDHNCATSYVAEKQANGSYKFLYIYTNEIDPTTRVSTPFIVNSAGDVFHIVKIGGHGSPVNTEQYFAVTPITAVTQDTELQIYIRELKITLETTFTAGTPASEPATQGTAVTENSGTHFLEYTRATGNESRDKDIMAYVSIVGDTTTTALAYDKNNSVDPATGAVTPHFSAMTLGSSNATNQADITKWVGTKATITWYVVVPIGTDTNNYVIESVEKITEPKTITSNADLVLPGDVSQKYLGQKVVPYISVAYGDITNNNGQEWLTDQILGTTVYKVISTFNANGTTATTKEGETVTGYYRVAARDQGERAAAAQTITLRTELSWGNATALKYSGITVSDKSPVVADGAIKYTMNAADAEDGVINIKITATDGTDEDDTNQRTGVESNIALYVALCGVSLFAVAGLVTVQVRKKDK